MDLDIDNIYVCSDLHLALGDSNKLDLIMNFISNLSLGDEFVIAGDMFEVFVGKLELQLTWQKYLLDYFRRAIVEQKRIFYVEGNRDYFISKLRGDVFIDVYPEVCYRGNNRIMIVHGDLINSKDRLYCLWRKVVKNSIIYKLSCIFPNKVVVRFIYWLERKLKMVNKRYKNYIPYEQIHNFIKNQREVDLIISGHFHKFIEIHYKDSVFVSLPSWVDYPNVLKVWLDSGNILYKLIRL